MTDKPTSLKDRIAQLECQVQALTVKVEQLSDLLKTSPQPHLRPTATVRELSPEQSFVPSEQLLSWVGKSSLLPRISTTCFILVLALILRTVTDNGLLDKEIGSLIGMTYAAALIGFGWRGYAKKSPLAPVVASFGAVLMFSIVLETHAHFEALPSVPAYLILISTGGAMAVISFSFSVDLPIQVGTLGMCIAGAALDFPNPVFLHLAALLLIANIFGFLASRLRRCIWLRWTLLGITLMMLQIWIFKIERITDLQGNPEKILTPKLFLPALALLTLCFLAMALVGMIRTGAVRWSKFNFSLPSIFSLWAFLAASQYLQVTDRDHLFLLGVAGVLTSAVFLGIAFGFTQEAADNPSLLNSFTLASLVLLPVSLPAMFGNTLIGLPLLSLTAYCLVLASGKWRSGGVRAMSYLMQLYACVDLAYLLCGNSPPSTPLTAMIIAGAVAAIGLSHYLWCRKHPPLPGVNIFSRFDKEDLTAVLLLIAALISGFCFVRTILFLAFDPTSNPEAIAAFRCAESISINVFAASLMILAFIRRNVEWRNIAIVITIIGAGKVFLSDLISTHGFPLVASVFVFGVAAALESVTLGRWTRRSAAEETEKAADQSDVSPSGKPVQPT
jgi:hypothetical protein